MLTDIHSHHSGPSCANRLVSCSMPGIGHDEWNESEYLSLSLHPWFVTTNNLPAQLEWIESHIHYPNVLAIGEAGLDKVCSTPFHLQFEAFRRAIALSERYHLPLIIHSVKTYNEIIHLKKELSPLQPWIIHGFRGKKEVMQMLLHHGFYLSFGERYNIESARLMPLKRMFIETDESNIKTEELYARMAQVRGMDETDFSKAIHNNIKCIFPISQNGHESEGGGANKKGYKPKLSIKPLLF